MFFPTFSPSPSILPIQYLLFIQHLTGYACALQSLLDTVPSGKRTEKNGSFHKDHTIFPAAPRQTPDSERQEKTGNSRECWKPKILRRKEEETDGLSMESLQKDGGGGKHSSRP